MDVLGRDLSGALERAERESKRNRFLSDLGSSIEFEELLDRDPRRRAWRSRASMPPWSPSRNQAAHRRSQPRGMTPEEEAHPPSAGTSDILPAGSITVSYRYGPGEAANTDLIRGGLFLVARRARGPHPRLPRAVLANPAIRAAAGADRRPRGDRSRLHPGDRERHGAIARRAGRPRRTRSPASSTSATSTRRCAARRSEPADTARKLALLILDFDDFKLVNDRIGHLAGDAVLAQFAERLRDQIRSVDIGCRIGGDEFAVILPESTAIDAEQLFARMHKAIETMTIPGGQSVRISAGIAELRHGETAAGSLRAGRYRAVSGEGVGQGSCRGRSRVATERTAVSRGMRDGVVAPPLLLDRDADGRARCHRSASADTTPSDPSKSPAGSGVAEPALLDPCLVRAAFDGATEPPDEENSLIALTDDEHEPSGRGGERNAHGSRAREHGHGASSAVSRAADIGPDPALRIDQRPCAEADGGEPGRRGEGDERRPAGPPFTGQPQGRKCGRSREWARRRGRYRRRRARSNGSVVHAR